MKILLELSAYLYSAVGAFGVHSLSGRVPKTGLYNSQDSEPTTRKSLLGTFRDAVLIANDNPEDVVLLKLDADIVFANQKTDYFTYDVYAKADL